MVIRSLSQLKVPGLKSGVESREFEPLITDYSLLISHNHGLNELMTQWLNDLLDDHRVISMLQLMDPVSQ